MMCPHWVSGFKFFGKTSLVANIEFRTGFGRFSQEVSTHDVRDEIEFGMPLRIEPGGLQVL